MAEVIPPAFKGIVVPVPTASSRRRQRGYDQAELIARQLAKLCGLRYTKLLRRRGNSRQVGSSRQLRRLQLADAFYLTHPSMVRGQSVLLIDDVLTTGATLEAAGQVVKQAGSKRVMAAVFAQA
jgi:ComF family protein